MRLVRYITPKRILPGMLDRSGELRDLSYVLEDITIDHFSPIDIDILYSIEPNTLPPVAEAHDYAAPISNTGAIFVGEIRAPDLHIIGPDAPLPTPAGPLLAGVAHIVGIAGWSGAHMLAMMDTAAGWMALGPVISTIKAVTNDLPLAASTQGDIVFRGQEMPRDANEVTFAVDGLGQQRHACRIIP